MSKIGKREAVALSKPANIAIRLLTTLEADSILGIHITTYEG